MRRSSSSSADGVGADLRLPIRVLVAEDSTTARRLIVEIFRSDPAFEVVGEAADGGEAVSQALDLRPDLVTMDVHMPVLDGLDATKEIMRRAPTPILIVSAAAARGDVELSLSATQAGALMAIAKPESPLEASFPAQRAQLLAMARAMAGVKVVRRWGETSRSTLERALAVAAAPRPRRGNGRPRLVAIASSAGGPAALRRILLDLPADFPVPIVIVQHISAGFLPGLVSWLGSNCPLAVRVAESGGAPRSGVYLAPDGCQLGFADGRFAFANAPPIGGFRPSADYLFASAARAYGSGALGIVLTGMGRDGADGLRALHAAGGYVLAQDEESSVVYGMAQEAVRAGVVDEVLPLEVIAPRLLELVA